ncbi:MAG: acyl-CoA dehydrogenase family protein [Candidatus Acetothermia bacterium]|nr:acyl-CoA dehydrogenase family protein [Candidatus Acetothermia bacterium]MDH7504710.1 acyl-CoA dehydrogenase family protein [Candidatus Acetothermia bacterium]
MEFEFTEEHKLLRRSVHEFVEERIKPLADKIDKEDRIPPELLAEIGELGYFGAVVPEEYGGSGFGEIGYCIVVEELSRGSSAVAVLVGAHESLAETTILIGGNEEQKRRFLPEMAAGKKLGAYALTEPEAGSDAGSIRMRAEERGDHYVLNGTKIFITNGSIADVIVTFAVTDPTLGPRGGITGFIVEKGMPGFSVDHVEEKMGLHGCPTAALSFKDVKVPKENVLGEVGGGFKLALTVLDYGRTSLAAGCLGGMKELLEVCTQYAQQRIQFGKPIAQQQVIQFMLADMAAKIYALESMVYRAAWLFDSGKEFIREASISKLLGSEWLGEAADMAVQIHGGYGYIKEYPVERFYRDARINRLFEGTSEIQRLVIARDVLKRGGY